MLKAGVFSKERRMLKDLKTAELVEIVENGWYLLTNETIFQLVKDDPTILEKLGLIFNITLEQFEVVNPGGLRLDPSRLVYFYKRRRLTRKGKYFLVGKEFRLFTAGGLKELMDIVDLPIPGSEKLLRIAEIAAEHGFIFRTRRGSYEVIDDFIPRVNRKKKGLILDYTFDSLPDKRRIKSRLLEKGMVKVGDKIYLLSSEIRKSLQMMGKYRKLTEENIENFRKDLITNFPETLLKKLSDRVEEVVFARLVKVPGVYRGKSTGGYKPDVLILEDLINGEMKKIDEDAELVKKVEKARRKGKRVIFYDGMWIDICSYKVEKKTGEKSRKRLLPLYDVKIKHNVKELEYVAPLEKRELLPKLSRHFKRKLYSFQMMGVGRMLYAYREGFQGFLLADDMGLGKTTQVLAFLSILYDMNKLFPALVVVPKALVENWVKQIELCFPVLKNHLITRDGFTKTRKDFLLITNYEDLRNNVLNYIDVEWKVVVLDEIQRIKNHTSKTSRVMKALKADFRVGMSGTPVENNIYELWNIYDFLHPGFLGTLKEFRKKYDLLNRDPFSGEGEKLARELYENLRILFIRRTKEHEELMNDLPGISYHEINVKMFPEQEEIYMEIAARFRKEGPEQFLKYAQYLLQVCDHPAVYDVEKYGDARSAKLEMLLKILEKIFRKKEKVLIFSRFLSTQAILKERIESEFGKKVHVINGQLNPQTREEKIGEFQKGEVDVLVINPRVGGVGLTLVEANNVVHYTVEWNPAVISQATDRVYRIGQTKDVEVYHLYSKFDKARFHTIEEYIRETLRKKKKISENIMIPLNVVEKAMGNSLKDYYRVLVKGMGK